MPDVEYLDQLWKAKTAVLFSLKTVRRNDTQHNLHFLVWKASLSGSDENQKPPLQQPRARSLGTGCIDKPVSRPFWITVRMVTTGECSRNHLTLFGCVTVHCERGIFLWGAIHQTSDLGVAWGAVIWCDLAQTLTGLWDCGWQIWCIHTQDVWTCYTVVYQWSTARCTCSKWSHRNMNRWPASHEITFQKNLVANDFQLSLM